MGATWYVLRSRWRRGIAGQLVLALVVALAGTMVLATLAGARRTETAYDRFVEGSRSPDSFVDVSGGSGVVFTEAQISAVRSLPQVTGSARLRALGMQPADEDLYQPTGAPVDDAWGRDVAVIRYVEGRAPRAAEELSLTEQRAALLGLSLGDTLALESFSQAQVDAVMLGDESALDHPEGPSVEFTLVGIERSPASVLTDRDISGFTFLTPAFLDVYGDQVGAWGEFVVLDLRGGSTAVPAFTDAVHAIPGLEQVQFEVGDDQTSGATDTLDFVARSLRILALIAGLAGIATVSLVMARTTAGHGSEDAVLGGLGVERSGRRRLLALGVAPGVLLGLLATAVGAVGASALFPFGLAGRAEPDPGVDVDPIALGIGLLVMAALLLTLALLASVGTVRSASRSVRAPRRSLLVEGLMGVGAPYPLVIGGRFVLERGSARRGMPARTAIAGVALGSAGLVAVLVFASSQSRLVDTPAAWGRTWDAPTAPEFSGPEYIPPDAVADRSVVHVAVVEVDGRPIEVRGFEIIEGTSLIPVVEGRAPGPGEVVLGAGFMDDIGVVIGDTVTIKGVSGEADLRVVGQGMFSGIADVPVLDQGAALDQATLTPISDPEADDGFDTVIVRFSPGVDREPIMRALAVANGSGRVEGDVERIAAGDRPDEFDRLDEARLLPWLLAGFLGLIAVTATAALLVTAVQRRRHDMAVLRAAGLGGSGVRAIVVAQATLVSALGLAFGVPLGLIAGRFAWRSVAEDLGVRVHLEFPIVPVLATIVVVVLVDVAVSLIPAHRAARAHPADELRAE